MHMNPAPPQSASAVHVDPIGSFTGNVTLSLQSTTNPSGDTVSGNPLGVAFSDASAPGDGNTINADGTATMTASAAASNATPTTQSDRRRFIAKAFGGANVLDGMKMPPIGEGNARFVREFLALEKIPLAAERLGGNHAVHLYFHTDTGKATVHTVDGSSLPKIVDTEISFGKPPFPYRSFSGEITLF